ncbi:MAG: hypothetical protein ACRD01_10210 [Terriglobales bacterium]
MNTAEARLGKQAGLAAVAAVLLSAAVALAQGRGPQPGHAIGTVTVQGHLIVMTLNPGALGRENLFDLNQRTLRFTPDGSGYRIANLPLQWDADFGPPATGAEVALRSFAFPFSGQRWHSMSVGMTGSIAFLPPLPAQPDSGRGRFGGRGGGVPVAQRFAQLRVLGRTLVGSSVPGICVFLRQRMRGHDYVKQMADRVVVTWDLSESYGGIQDYSWTPRVNRFQAVLHQDGTIEMSYQNVTTRDAIVGVYPHLDAAGPAVAMATLPAAAGSQGLRALTLATVDGVLTKVTFETAGPVPAPADAGAASYEVEFRTPAIATGASGVGRAQWTVRAGRLGSGRGAGGRGRGGPAPAPAYHASGTGVEAAVTVVGNSLSIVGVLPEEFKNGDSVTVSARASVGRTPAGEVAARTVRLSGMRDPEADLSSLKPAQGPFPVAYESFHYYDLPDNRDLACTVIQGLGDHYDFLTYYSDFRVDNAEAGTSSEGPRGSGQYAVTGIGTQADPGGQPRVANYCSPGRFQWGFIQPVWAGAVQMQEYPPLGTQSSNRDDIGDYIAQLRERTQNGRIPPYDYAMSQIGHELGHRWSAFATAKVNGASIVLGPVHWAMGLQARAPFPYQRPTEASAMGGGVWQDNHDGTYTQLDDNYYVPATGYSYLDLYFMGLIAPAEVPNFFILRDLQPAGTDAAGHRIFKADRTDITIQDVIAAEGPRQPDVEHSQKAFNTGMVLIEQHGHQPSPELIERVSGIRLRWMDYFATVTGHRAVMTANPR